MAGKMKNCPSCGKLFVANALMRVCRDCLEKEQKLEADVIAYVRENPKCTLPEIIDATKAPEPLIKRMIAQGRFIQTGVKLSYPCEKCGKPITDGKLCTSCMDAVKAQFQATAAKIAPPAKKDAAPAQDRGRGMYTTKW